MKKAHLFEDREPDILPRNFKLKSRSERRALDRREKKEAKRTQETQKSIQLKTRRKFLQLGLGAAGAIVGGKTIMEYFRTHPSPEFEVDESIPMPESMFEDQPVNFPKPNLLELNNHEYRTICSMIGENIDLVLKNSIKPTLQNDPELQNSIIQKFLGDTAILMKSIHPKFSDDMTRFQMTWDKQPETLVRQMNTYLMSGGYYLLYRFEKGTMIVNLFRIGETFHIRIKDRFGEELIPVLALQAPSIDGPMGGRVEGHCATMDQFLEQALLFEDEFESTIVRELRDRPAYPRFLREVDEHQFRVEMKRSLLHHEAVHGFLARRFPNVAKNNRVNEEYFVPFDVSIGDKMLNLSGSYLPMEFQELCGVGAELAFSKVSIPNEHTSNLVDLKEVPRPYHFVVKLMPLITLRVAPDTALKRKVLENLLEGNANIEKIKEMVGTEPFEQIHTQKAGEIMYKVGYNFIRQAEKGVLKKPLENPQKS